jgi:hypothetical protein
MRTSTTSAGWRVCPRAAARRAAGATALIVALTVLAAPRPCRGAEVQNINELCQEYVFFAKTDKDKARLREESTRSGLLYQFRYLEVRAIQTNAPTTGAYTLVTVEPASEMEIQMVLKQEHSLEIVKSLRLGEAVAGKGKIVSMDKDGSKRILLDPAMLKNKDRLSPKREKELLKEVDPKAY